MLWGNSRSKGWGCCSTLATLHSQVNACASFTLTSYVSIYSSHVNIRLLTRADELDERAVPHLEVVNDESRVERLQLPRILEIFGGLFEFPERPAGKITTDNGTETEFAEFKNRLA
jgi:hypothetical protein